MKIKKLNEYSMPKLWNRVAKQLPNQKNIPVEIDKDQLEYLKDLVSDILISNDIDLVPFFDIGKKWISDNQYHFSVNIHITNNRPSSFDIRTSDNVKLYLTDVSENIDNEYKLSKVFVSLVNRLINMGYDVFGVKGLHNYTIQIASIEGKLI